MKPNYFVLGTNDRDASVAFYDAIFEGTGVDQIFANDRMTYWGGGGFVFAVAVPFDTQPATAGNGTMVGFEVTSNDEVHNLHQKVLDLGGSSEGAPSQRGPMYSAYARDLDGNKLGFYVQSGT